MNKYDLKYPIKRIVLLSIAIFISLSFLLIYIVSNVNDQLHKTQVIETTDDYIGFQYNLTKLIESTSTLLTGYEAYLKVNDPLDDLEVEAYLSHLIEEEKHYIRNIATIKDTTIIHNYPLKGNESSIGINLADIDGQKENVLLVKNTNQGYIDGPVDLVQGGRGYIIRKPLEDITHNYWGQVSIVLHADLIDQAIMSYAEESGIRVAIYENHTLDKLIYGDPTILELNPSVYSLNSSLSRWVIYVIPKNGWPSNQSILMPITFLGLMIIIGTITALVYIQLTHFNLHKVVSRDNLTGLYNRHHLEIVQEQVSRDADLRKGSYGLMHIDLNHFKNINDAYGHSAGDEVLIEIARILNLFTRDDELVFRVGGDEFLIILPQVSSKADLTLFKDRLKDTFKTNYRLGHYKVSIGPSVGVAMYPEDGSDFDQVLKKADEAMYNEKGSHKR